MIEAHLTALLEAVREGRTAPDDAVAELRRLPWADLGFARVDHHRTLRQGTAEVVYGPGKAIEHLVAIVGELLAGGTGPVLVSRASGEQAAAALAAHPGGEQRSATLVWRPADPRAERVVLACAGTADLPVAEECAAVLGAHGFQAIRLTDVGVAGVHRLLAHGDELATADAVVVVAGMEGALASLVGGLTPAPVVAVPTSVGYGAALEGVTALLAMLSSCAAGITVVGIDNGYGAACAVVRLLGAHPGHGGGTMTEGSADPTTTGAGDACSEQPAPEGGAGTPVAGAQASPTTTGTGDTGLERQMPDGTGARSVRAPASRRTSGGGGAAPEEELAERSEGMSGARAPASRTTMGRGGAAPEQR